MARQISRASDGLGLKWANSALKYKKVDIEALVSSDVTLEIVAAGLQQMLQDEEDIVVKRSDLPDDEDTKNTDPKRTNIFWRGEDIVVRSNIITIAVVNGELVPTVRVA